MSESVAIGLWLGRGRIGRWALLRVGGSALAALVIVAILRRLSGSTGGSPLGLVSAVHLGLVVPLVSTHWVRQLTPTQSALLAEPFARTGADRRGLALGQLLVTVLVALGFVFPLALFATGLDAATERVLSGSGLRLVIASGWASLAYVLLGVATRARWPRAGLSGLLLFDWLLGSGEGLLALPWPRALARGIACGTPPLSLGMLECTLLLAVICSSATAWWLGRTPS